MKEFVNSLIRKIKRSKILKALYYEEFNEYGAYCKAFVEFIDYPKRKYVESITIVGCSAIEDEYKFRLKYWSDNTRAIIDIDKLDSENEEINRLIGGLFDIIKSIGEEVPSETKIPDVQYILPPDICMKCRN